MRLDCPRRLSMAIDFRSREDLDVDDISSVVIGRAMRDNSFRDRLMIDPERAITDLLGCDIPAGLRVRVVEETPGSVVLVLPARKPSSSGEHDIDLDQLVGMTASQTHVSCCQCSSTSTRTLD
jgi:hypothetical protein